MYVNEIRINYFERLNIVKQKIINKINKFRKVVNVTIKIIVIQYKQEIVNENIYAIKKKIIIARTTCEEKE